MGVLSYLRRQASRLLGGPQPFATDPAREAIYRDLFVRELAKLDIDDRFFPVGGAANYSLLYTILRIGAEYRPARVLDIGAGQSSLLWDDLARKGLAGAVLTLESDPGWGARIGAQVEHEIIITPLREENIAGISSRTYDWEAIRQRGPFDVIVCDGPIGLPRHSRRGVLSLIDTSLPGDFIVVLDDAERSGEQDTIEAIHVRLQSLGRDYRAEGVRAAKSQAIFAGGRLSGAVFL